MARVMWGKDTDIYRMKVEIKLNGGKVSTTYYGPHDQSNQARDHSTDYRTSPKRLTKQKLGIRDGELSWLTGSVKYRNGGELVDWDA